MTMCWEQSARQDKGLASGRVYSSLECATEMDSTCLKSRVSFVAYRYVFWRLTVRIEAVPGEGEIVVNRGFTLTGARSGEWGGGGRGRVWFWTTSSVGVVQEAPIQME